VVVLAACQVASTAARTWAAGRRGGEAGGAGQVGGLPGVVAVEHRVDHHPDGGLGAGDARGRLQAVKAGHARRSITALSGWSRAAMATACRPSAASPMTGKPLSSSRPRSAARVATASSASSTGGGGVGSVAGLGGRAPPDRPGRAVGDRPVGLRLAGRQPHGEPATKWFGD
jgi:hypothetical protein